MAVVFVWVRWSLSVGFRVSSDLKLWGSVANPDPNYWIGLGQKNYTLVDVEEHLPANERDFLAIGGVISIQH